MREFISFALLVAIMIPIGGGLILVIKNELETRVKATGGYGLVPVIGMMIVFVGMPVFAYFVRF